MASSRFNNFFVSFDLIWDMTVSVYVWPTILYMWQALGHCQQVLSMDVLLGQAPSRLAIASSWTVHLAASLYTKFMRVCAIHWYDLICLMKSINQLTQLCNDLNLNPNQMSCKWKRTSARCNPLITCSLEISGKWLVCMPQAARAKSIAVCFKEWMNGHLNTYLRHPKTS